MTMNRAKWTEFAALTRRHANSDRGAREALSSFGVTLEDGYCLFAESIRKNCRHGGALRIDHVMRLFRLFHKQHVWLVHTDRSCAFFLCGVGSQGDEHVPSGQRAKPEYRVGNPT